MSNFLDSTLQHMSVCTSQYDATCRALADDLLKARETIRELLKGEEHEGNCPADDECMKCFYARERRELAATELLKGTDA